MGCGTLIGCRVSMRGRGASGTPDGTGRAPPRPTRPEVAGRTRSKALAESPVRMRLQTWVGILARPHLRT